METNPIGRVRIEIPNVETKTGAPGERRESFAHQGRKGVAHAGANWRKATHV